MACKYTDLQVYLSSGGAAIAPQTSPRIALLSFVMNLPFFAPKRLGSFMVVTALLWATVAPLSATMAPAAVWAAEVDGATLPVPQEMVASQGVVEEAKVSENSATDETVIKLRDGREFRFSNDPPPELAQQYAELDSFHKQMFQRRRIGLLKMMVPAFAHSRFGLGVTSVVAKPLVRGTKYLLYHLTLRKFERLNPFTEMARDTLPADQQTSRNLKERGEYALRETLKWYERFLWNRMYLLTRDQFVIKGGVGIVAQGAMMKLKYKDYSLWKLEYARGGIYGYSFRFGYDSTSKRFILDFIKEREDIQKGICPFLFGLSLKGGISMFSSKPDGTCIESDNYYAPGIPINIGGSRYYSEIAFSTQAVAIPPMVGDWFSYKSKYQTNLPPKLKSKRGGQAIGEAITDEQVPVAELGATIEDLATRIYERDVREMTAAARECQEKLLNQDRTGN
jgi:hypothetical protein